MAGRTITDLPIPEDSCRIDLHSEEFETAEFASEEDAKRARRLKRYANATNDAERRTEALELANLLDPSVTPGVPQTLASSRYMRELRIMVLGALWKAIKRFGIENARRCDIINPKWAVADLSELDPVVLKERLRADLNRAGARDADGYLFAALHNEWDIQAELYQPHFHVVAAGGMIDVIKKLKKSPSYRSTRRKDCTRKDGRVADPIILRKKPMTYVAYAISYVLKGYCPAKTKRNASHKRLPNPQHSEFLIWMDEVHPSDIIYMMKMKLY